MTDTLPRIAHDAPDALIEQLLEAQAPQRPLTSPAFTVEIDGRQFTGREGPDHPRDLPRQRH
jgi:hypothetical protein